MNTTLLPLRALGALRDAFTQMSLGLASPDRVEGNYSPRENARAELNRTVGDTLKRHLPFTCHEGWFEFTPYAQSRPLIVRAIDQFRSIDLLIAEVSMCCWSCQVAQSATDATQEFADKLNKQIGMEVFSLSGSGSGVYLVAQVSPYEGTSFKLLLAGCSIAIKRCFDDFENRATITNASLDATKNSN